MAYGLNTFLILGIWVIQFRTRVMKNYMEKGIIPQITTCKVIVLIPITKKEMR
jgi:hypothetical protein